jgi:hypothetical protein
VVRCWDVELYQLPSGNSPTPYWAFFPVANWASINAILGAHTSNTVRVLR